MDFRNLCQKIDVDSIRAKIPAMPALPQIKMPKSMPKLKSRKIFRSSRENVNAKESPKPLQRPPPHPPADFITHTPQRISTISSLVLEGAAADSRDQQHYTYRSACSIDDDYPSPLQARRFDRRTARPISPVRMPLESPQFATPTPGGGSSASVRMSLADKLQKGYRDLTDFRFKHIFAKKTVVRRDNIEVDTYVQRYEEDLAREQVVQERRDRSIADNYRFKFKVSRQNTGHTNSISSNESPASEPTKTTTTRATAKAPGRSVSEQSGDESGMEASPPKRRPGIAATRFAKMRDPPLSRTMSEDSTESRTRAAIADFDDDDDDDYVGMQPAADDAAGPNSSTLWSIKQSRTVVEASPLVVDDEEPKAAAVVAKSRGYKERMRRLTSYVSSHDESGAESGPEVAATGGGAKILSKLRGFGRSEEADAQPEKKRKAPLTPQQSEERELAAAKAPTAGEKSLDAIKQNFKRIRKSMKMPQQQAPPPPPAEDSDEDECKDTKPGTRAQRLAARLRQFASREDLSVDGGAKKERSPIHAVISNKLQTWKKSFKRSQSEASEAHSGDETSPEKPKRPDSLLHKLRHIRARKQPNSTEELDVDEHDEASGKTKESAAGRKSSNLEEKFEQARQRTMKKVNEKMQQIKFFHRSQDHVEKDAAKKGSGNETDDEEVGGGGAEAAFNNAHPIISRRNVNDTDRNEHSSDQEEIEQIAAAEYTTRTTRAAWTTKPILSDSPDESDDNDAQFPRVLIHQDNSDAFESTLIISVTRSSASVSPTPQITEIPTGPKPKPAEWVPNTQIISSFIELTPPGKRRMSADAIAVAGQGPGHARKHSMDSNSDSDTWMPLSQLPPLPAITDAARRTSLAGLNSIVENEEPWRVHGMFRDEKLYKSKSIDIFEATAKKGGAFADFDDELKNEPVVKIVDASSSSFVDSFEKDSSEDPDAADDDNSSRVTKILVTRTDRIDVRVERATPLKGKKAAEARVFANSRESLNTGHNGRDEIFYDDDDDDDDDDDRPPSIPPSPPPSVSPPPPPLPQRKPPVLAARTAEAANPPAMPTIKPPPPPPTQSPPVHLPRAAAPVPPAPLAQPPKIPERTASMSRIARPLVKTSSLRLAYSEQVKPADVGKVNKLISRFEQPPAGRAQRPRIISRRPRRDDSDDFTDEDEDDDDEEDDDDDDDESDNANYDENNLSDVEDCDEQCVKVGRGGRVKLDRDFTPTPTNTPKATLLLKEAPQPTRASAPIGSKSPPSAAPPPTGRDAANNMGGNLLQLQSPAANIPKISLSLDSNSNCSRAGSEYGSPLAYPSSLVGSASTTPTPDRRPQQHDLLHAARSRRSMTRDDDNFQSFDSDEENSYYSISSSGSSRYVVEI